MPHARDFRYILQLVKFNLGLSTRKPQDGRYAFAERLILWALTWGSLIMIISGFMMLNPIATTKILPGVFVPMAKVAHGLEAILAVLALLVWHFYFYLVKLLNSIAASKPDAMKIPSSMHPLEVADIRDGQTVYAVDKTLIVKWWKTVLPQYLFITGVLLACMLYFTNFEGTSILTVISPENVTVYSPLEQEITAEGERREPTSVPVIPPGQVHENIAVTYTHSWLTCINNLVLVNCIGCHETLAEGMINLRDYDSIIYSGIVKPGNPSDSTILKALMDEQHYSLSNRDKLIEILTDWISSGAPRELEIAPEQLRMFANISWVSDIKSILNERCTECHGASAYHDLDLRTYNSTMDSGVVWFSSPDESPILIKIGLEGHPGQFSGPELIAVHEWVLHGAPSGMSVEDATREYRERALTAPAEGPEIETAEPEILTAANPVWPDIESILSPSCTGCHGSNAMGGLDLTSYESLMDSDSVIANNPDDSPLVLKMESGNHPILLSDEDLDTVRTWISQGALSEAGSEMPESAEDQETMTMSQVWDDSIADILHASCLGCHGENAMGGLDLTTYESAMNSGAIIPGDADGSTLVIKMKSGSHPTLLSEDDLQAVIDWINLGS